MFGNFGRGRAWWKGGDVDEIWDGFESIFPPDTFNLLRGQRQANYVVSETDDAVVFEVDLPGTPKKDVSVRLDDHVLLISGARHYKKQTAGGFQKGTEELKLRFRISEVTTDEHIKAKLQDGVLTVTVQKVKEPKPPANQGTEIPLE